MTNRFHLRVLNRRSAVSSGSRIRLRLHSKGGHRPLREEERGMHILLRPFPVLVLCVFVANPSPSVAQQAPPAKVASPGDVGSAESLQKATQNPVASLISVPL